MVTDLVRKREDFETQSKIAFPGASRGRSDGGSIPTLYKQDEEGLRRVCTKNTPTGSVFPSAFPPEAQLKFTLKRELFCKSDFAFVFSVTQTACLKSRELEGIRVQKSQERCIALLSKSCLEPRPCPWETRRAARSSGLAHFSLLRKQLPREFAQTHSPSYCSKDREGRREGGR